MNQLDHKIVIPMEMRAIIRKRTLAVF